MELLEGGDDAFEVVLDSAVVVDQALLTVGFGDLEQLLVVLGVLAVDGQELDGGLELGAGQAGVGVGAFLLGRPAAVAVGKAGLDAVEVVLDPLRPGGG